MSNERTQAQVIKLSPIQFSSYPKSNPHHYYEQIPGYRILIVYHNGEKDLKPFIDDYLASKINKLKSSFGYYRKYKISRDGQS